MLSMFGLSICQEKVPTADKLELAAMDTEAEALSKVNEQLQAEVNALANKHKKLVSNMTLQEAKAKLEDVTSQVRENDWCILYKYFESNSC